MIVVNPSMPIVVVDDDDVDRMIIGRVLERSNLANDLVAFDSANAALDHLHSAAAGNVAVPGLVLSDINMPVLSGFDLLKEIREIPDLAMIPIVIMLSSSEAISDKERAIELGASAYLVKQSGIDTFVEVINRTLTNET